MAYSDIEMHKRGHGVASVDERNSGSEDGSPVELGSKERDREDMARMGKAQQFKRNFSLPTNFAFVALAQGTWEIVLSATAGSLSNGGRGGLVWTYLASYIAFGSIVYSLAEMAAMAPTAGGQYHWTSEFAPKKYQASLSYISGWLSMLSWQCGTASGMYLQGATLQAIVTLVYTDYSPQPYQAYLIMFALTTAAALFNVYLARYLPMLEGMMLLLHLLSFFAVLITLAVLSPTVSASEVFTTFESGSGYGSLGLSILVGQISAVYGLIGSDGAVHMAEETADAAKNVPRSMVYSYTISGLLGFAMLLLYLFCLTDVEGALGSTPGSLGFPYLYVFVTGTGSAKAAVGLGVIILILGFAGALSFLASASRQTFAFARDKGVPFHTMLAAVDPKLLVPKWSVVFTWGFTVLLCLIKIGSNVAFNAIISLQLLALLSTYALSIGCLIYKRLTHQPLPPSPRTMNRGMGLTINIIAFFYAIFIMIFCCFPSMVPVNTENFNWAPVIYTGVCLMAAVYYFTYGRKSYVGPVVFVRPM